MAASKVLSLLLECEAGIELSAKLPLFAQSTLLLLLLVRS